MCVGFTYVNDLFSHGHVVLPNMGEKKTNMRISVSCVVHVSQNHGFDSWIVKIYGVEVS
jgi:hypothetical protein